MAPVVHGRPTLKVDAGVGPLRLGQRVETVEHGTTGQLLGAARVVYRLGDRGILYAHYASDLRIDRIEPSIKVELGKVNFKRWRHYSCRPGRVYRHTTQAKWTAVLVIEPRVARDRRRRRRSEDLRCARPCPATPERLSPPLHRATHAPGGLSLITWARLLR